MNHSIVFLSSYIYMNCLNKLVHFPMPKMRAKKESTMKAWDCCLSFLAEELRVQCATSQKNVLARSIFLFSVIIFCSLQGKNNLSNQWFHMQQTGLLSAQTLSLFSSYMFAQAQREEQSQVRGKKRSVIIHLALLLIENGSLHCAPPPAVIRAQWPCHLRGGPCFTLGSRRAAHVSLWSSGRLTLKLGFLKKMWVELWVIARVLLFSVLSGF